MKGTWDSRKRRMLCILSMLEDSRNSLDLACLGNGNLRPNDGGRERQGRCSPAPLACSPVLCSQSGPSAQDLAEYVCSVFTFVLCLSLFLFLPSKPSSESHVLREGFPARFYCTWCLSSLSHPSTRPGHHGLGTMCPCAWGSGTSIISVHLFYPHQRPPLSVLPTAPINIMCRQS